jgi:ApbE superfamily uncharacterized protein (UPF0280 family)
LATVAAADGALADACATLAANLVKSEADLDGALQRVQAIPGVRGVLLVKNERVGLAGKLPRLVRHADREFPLKITRDPRSGVAIPY